jgi:hypothetical protein
MSYLAIGDQTRLNVALMSAQFKDTIQITSSFSAVNSRDGSAVSNVTGREKMERTKPRFESGTR